MTIIYKDTQLTAERREGMLRIESRHVPNSGDDGDGAWLSADEALFLAESIIAAFKTVEKAA